MKLEDLTAAEQNALARLIRLVVRLDGVTPDERERLGEIAVDLGEEQFWSLLEKSHSSKDSFADCVAAVERQEVRELIYGVLLGISLVGTIDSAEQRALDRLVDEWEIEETTEMPMEDDFDYDGEVDEDDDEDDDESEEESEEQ